MTVTAGLCCDASGAVLWIAGKTAGSVYVVSAIPFSEKVRDCTGAIAS
jgi:hypothetical protein